MHRISIAARVAAALTDVALCPVCGTEGAKQGPYGHDYVTSTQTETFWFKCPRCVGPRQYFTFDGRVWHAHADDQGWKPYVKPT